MIRRFGAAPRNNIRYTRRPGVYAVLPRDGQILLTRQSQPTSELQLPGGGIDPGESPIRALHREVLEETGWRIATPTRLGAFRRFTFMPDYDLMAEKLCTIYLARPVCALHPPIEPDHVAVWTSPDVALRTLDNDGDAYFLHQVIRTFLS